MSIKTIPRNSLKTPKKQQDQPKGALDHLEDLRKLIIRIGVTLIITTIIAFIFVKKLISSLVFGILSKDFITNKILCSLYEPFCLTEFPVTFQAIKPTEQFTKAISFAVFIGFIFAFPVIIYMIWRYLKPALLPKEQKIIKKVLLPIILLFITGVFFSYFILMPFMLNFFAHFSLHESIENRWQIGSIISLIAQTCLLTGLLFEMPIVSYYLGLIGFLSSSFLAKYRKHAIVIIMLIAGILTPSPDVISQLVLGIPMYLLYELSINVVKKAEKKRAKNI